MKNSFALVWLCLALAPVLPGTLLATETEDPDDGTFHLAYRAAEQDAFTLDVTRRHLTARDFLGNLTRSHEVERSRFSLEIREVGPDGLDLVLTYAEKERESNGQPSPADFSPLIGREVRFRLGGDGTISRTSGFASLPEVFVPDMGQALQTDHYLNEVLFLLPGLPDRSVAVGDR